MLKRIFVIGASGYGKTTYAKRLIGACPDKMAYLSAGAWVRTLLQDDEHSPEAAKRLSAGTLRALQENPLAALDQLTRMLNECVHSPTVVIDGCRNPVDLLGLAHAGDHVVDLGGVGASPFEVAGLKAIRASRDLLALLGVTWADAPRTFADLPLPLPASVRGAFLRDGKPGADEDGWVVAFASYPGEPVTAVWRSAISGGEFFDLPLAAFVVPTTEQAEVPREEAEGYMLAGKGPLCVEAVPSGGPADVIVFGRDRALLSKGVVRACLHWPEDNELVYLVQVGSMLLLRPPHKLLFGTDKVPRLPAWEKRRTLLGLGWVQPSEREAWAEAEAKLRVVAMGEHHFNCAYCAVCGEPQDTDKPCVGTKEAV